MNISFRPLFTIALGTLTAAMTLGVAHAEPYQGVHTVNSQRSAESVRAEAVTAARAPDQNVVLGSRGPLPFKALASRESVHLEARAVPLRPDSNVVPGSRVNSKVISTMNVEPTASKVAESKH